MNGCSFAVQYDLVSGSAFFLTQGYPDIYFGLRASMRSILPASGVRLCVAMERAFVLTPPRFEDLLSSGSLLRCHSQK